MSFVEPLTTETERKLFVMLQNKWRKMSNMQYRKGIVRIKDVTDSWESYIKDSGVNLLSTAWCRSQVYEWFGRAI